MAQATVTITIDTSEPEIPIPSEEVIAEIVGDAFADNGWNVVVIVGSLSV